MTTEMETKSLAPRTQTNRTPTTFQELKILEMTQGTRALFIEFRTITCLSKLTLESRSILTQ